MKDSEIQQFMQLVTNKFHEVETRMRLLNTEIEKLKLENQFERTGRQQRIVNK